MPLLNLCLIRMFWWCLPDLDLSLARSHWRAAIIHHGKLSRWAIQAWHDREEYLKTAVLIMWTKHFFSRPSLCGCAKWINRVFPFSSLALKWSYMIMFLCLEWLAMPLYYCVLNRGVDHLYFPEKPRGLSGHVQFAADEGRPTGDGLLLTAQCPQPNDLLSGETQFAKRTSWSRIAYFIVGCKRCIGGCLVTVWLVT